MKHFTYANVASTLALIIAVGGGGAAVAATVAKNSVGSPQIINGSIKAADLKQGSVNGSKVKNNSLTGADIKNGTITGSDVGDGTLTRADLTGQPMGMFAAYARVNEHSSETTVPDGYFYNSGGGDVTVTKGFPGRYTVKFDAAETAGALAVAFSASSEDMCRATGWNSSGLVEVECLDAAGSGSAASFVVAFLN